MEQDIHQYYEARNPGEVVVLGADLFNCTLSGLGGFAQETGATYPLLLLSAVNTGGYFPSLYGERDHYVVINKQGIVRYQANDRWPYGNGYHLAEIRACVDSLVKPQRPIGMRLVVRKPAGSPREEGAGLSVIAAPSGQAVTLVLDNPFGHAAEARVTVHDLAGRRVATLLDGTAAPGTSTLIWEGRTLDGRSAPPGIYLVRADLAGHHLSRRIALVR